MAHEANPDNKRARKPQTVGIVLTKGYESAEGPRRPGDTIRVSRAEADRLMKLGACVHA